MVYLMCVLLDYDMFELIKSYKKRKETVLGKFQLTFHGHTRQLIELMCKDSGTALTLVYT
jgi:hypothetical protein